MKSLRRQSLSGSCQIACDKKAVGPCFSCLFNDSGKRVADIAGPFPAPWFVTVRGHAPVDIAGMYKLHNDPPLIVNSV